MDNQERIERNFTYHAPSSDDVWKMHSIRDHAKTLALLIDVYVPDSREKSTALTKLQETSMWANAGIILNQDSATTPEAEGTGVLTPGATATLESIQQSMWFNDLEGTSLPSFQSPQDAIDAIRGVVASHAPTPPRSGGCGRDGGCGNCKCQG